MLHKFHCIILSLLLLLVFQSSALADPDYEIVRYTMTVEVGTDGSADILEVLDYDFDGDYNGVVSLFDTDGIDGVENFRVFIDDVEMTPVDQMNYENNTYTVTENGSLSEIRIYSPGRSGLRRVRYEYTMTGLARRYSDTGMIYRKLIGENNAVSLQNASIAISLPGDCSGEQIDLFVRGMDEASSGEEFLSIGPKTVKPGTFVEVRLLFPDEWLSDAPLIDQPMYEATLAEEARIKEEADARAARFETAKYIFTAAYLLIFFSLWLMMARKYGLKKKHCAAPDSSIVANYPAAFVTAAAEEEADTDALTGTLMELVAQGRLSMEQAESGDLLFSLNNPDPAGLYPHQAALIDWLFDGRSSFLISELNAGTDYDLAQAFENGYSWYVSKVSSDMLTANLRFRNDGLRITVNTLIILFGLMGAGGILLSGTVNAFLGLLVGGALFVLLYLTSRIRRLTDEGEQLALAAEAFREAGIPEGRPYTEYVAYYAALGMTEPLVQAMEHVSAGHPANMPAWMFAGWHHSLHSLNHSLRDTHHHNASIPNPNASSSGSRGSNGGGGGHGAW